MRSLGKTGRLRRRNRRIARQKSPIDHNIIELTVWMKRKGFRNNLLLPYDFSDTGRGLRCRKVVRAGDCIMSIPRELLITTTTVLDSYIGNVLEMHQHILRPRQLLCLFLVYEKQKGTQSEWYFYIRTLPEIYTNVANWSKEDISWLPSDLQHQAMLLRDEVNTTFAEIQNVISDIELHHPDLRSIMSLDQYLWAWSAINTRCVYMKQPKSEFVSKEEENHYALAPYLDLLNHSSEAQVRAAYNEKSNCFEINTDVPYKRWGQAFISYGPHDNSKLLVEYGFILPKNHQNSVLICRDDLNYLNVSYKFPYFAEKLTLFEEQGILRGMSITDSGFSWALITAIAILISLQQKRSTWLNFISGLCEPNCQERGFSQVALTLVNRKSHDFKISKENPRNLHQHLACTLRQQLSHILHKSKDVFKDTM